MYASVATREFLSLMLELKTLYISTSLIYSSYVSKQVRYIFITLFSDSDILINRYYVTGGVRLYSQETWEHYLRTGCTTSREIH